MWRVAILSFLFTAVFCFPSLATSEGYCGTRVAREQRFAGLEPAQVASTQKIIDALGREGLLYAIANQVLEALHLSPADRANWRQLRTAFALAPEYDDVLNAVAFQLLRELQSGTGVYLSALRSSNLGISVELYNEAATRLRAGSRLDAQILVRAIDNNFQNRPQALIKGIEKQHAFFWWNQDIKRNLSDLQTLPRRTADRMEVRVFLSKTQPILREAAGWIMLTSEIEVGSSEGFVAYVTELSGVDPESLFVESAWLAIEQKATAKAQQTARIRLARARELRLARIAELEQRLGAALTDFESALAARRRIVAATDRHTRSQLAVEAQAAAESDLPFPEAIRLSVELSDKVAQVKALRSSSGVVRLTPQLPESPNALVTGFLTQSLKSNISGDQSDESRQALVTIIAGEPGVYRARQDVMTLGLLALQETRDNDDRDDEERAAILKAVHDAFVRYPGGLITDDISELRKAMLKVVSKHNLLGDDLELARSATHSLVWILKLRIASNELRPATLPDAERALFQILIKDLLGTYENETEIDETFTVFSNAAFAGLFDGEVVHQQVVAIMLAVKRPWSDDDYEKQYLEKILAWFLARPRGVSNDVGHLFLRDFKESLAKTIGDEDVREEVDGQIPPLARWMELDALARTPAPVDVTAPPSEQTDSEAIQILLREITELERQLDALTIAAPVRGQLATRDRNYRSQLSTALEVWLASFNTDRSATEQEALRVTFHRITREWGSVRMMQFLQSLVTVDFLRRLNVAPDRATNESQVSALARIIRSLPISQERATSLILGTIAMLQRDMTDPRPRLNEAARSAVIQFCVHDFVVNRSPAFSVTQVARIRDSAERRLTSTEQNRLFNSSPWRAASAGRHTSEGLADRLGQLDQRIQRLEILVDGARLRLTEAQAEAGPGQ